MDFRNTAGPCRVLFQQYSGELVWFLELRCKSFRTPLPKATPPDTTATRRRPGPAAPRTLDHISVQIKTLVIVIFAIMWQLHQSCAPSLCCALCENARIISETSWDPTLWTTLSELKYPWGLWSIYFTMLREKRSKQRPRQFFYLTKRLTVGRYLQPGYNQSDGGALGDAGLRVSWEIKIDRDHYSVGL